MYENRPYSEPKKGTSGNTAADIAAEFAACMNRGDSPDSPAAQSAAERWWNACHTACCGTIDAESCGTGTAKYITEAIEFYRKGR